MIFQACFVNKDELQAAVDGYIAQNCATNRNTSFCLGLETSYGWPIGTWCVSQVTDMSYLFSNKETFNEDLSGWDVSSVSNMGFMLDGATSFNQDLCAWGDKFPYDNALGIFFESGCTFQDSPQEYQKGPFCASSCITSPSTSPSSSLSPITALRPSTSPTETCRQVDITVVFDEWASQTSWDVQRINNIGDNTILKTFSGTESESFKTQKESICLQEGEYQFTVIDLWGLGIAHYNMTSYGEIIKEGGDFVSSESTVFSIPFVAP